MSSDPPTPAQVLAIYSEPLARGRRVAVVGSRGASGRRDDGVVDLLLDLGARSVHVYDPTLSPSRQGHEITTPQRDGRVTVLPYPVRGPVRGPIPGAVPGAFSGARDLTFDLVLLPDLSELGAYGELGESFAHLRRLVGLRGTVVVASRNPDLRSDSMPVLPSYLELYDACARHFSDVRMGGIAPFAGYAVAEFAPDREPTVAFDSTFADPSEPPLWFVAVAGMQPPAAPLEAYEIVQIPTNANSANAIVDRRAEVQLRALQEQLVALQGELENARKRGNHNERELAAARGLLNDKENDAERATAAAQRKIAEVEDRVARLQRQLSESLVQCDREREAAERLRQTAQSAEASLGPMRAQLAASEADRAAEVVEIEAALRACGDELRIARTDNARKERIARELIAQLQHTATPAASAGPQAVVGDNFRDLAQQLAERDAAVEDLRRSLDEAHRRIEQTHAKLDRLAQEAAAREADLQSAAWKIAELETLSSAPRAPHGGADSKKPELNDEKMSDEMVDALEDLNSNERAAMAPSPR